MTNELDPCGIGQVWWAGTSDDAASREAEQREMERAEMTEKRVRTGARWRLAAGLLLTAITPELIGVWLFIVAPEHMRAIFSEPESWGMSLFVAFVAHLAQIPLLVLFCSYWWAVTGGSAAAGKIRLCLLVPAIIATDYILFRLRVFGMYGVLIPGLSYLISLVLLTTRPHSPQSEQ